MDKQIGNNFSLEKSIELLSKTPKIIRTLLQNLSEDWIYTNEGESTWNPFDILGHFLYGDETDWIPRAIIILGETDNKTFPSFDRFAQFETSKNKTLDQLLDEFSEIRKNKIFELNQLEITENKLDLKGIHPELGEVTLRQLIATWVVHDLSHIAHILRIMANQYKLEVGPWIEYLRILN